MATLEFFFDCSSPWTYIGFHNIQPLAKEFGVPITWKPILVGGVFNAVNPSVYASRENPVLAKEAYRDKDIADWARHSGIVVRWKPPVFPAFIPAAMRRNFACVPPKPIWNGWKMSSFSWKARSKA